MKKIVAFILLCFSVTLWSQKIDPNAKRLLDTASEKLSKNSTFYIKFNYLYVIPGQKSTAETGQIYAAGEKYHLILPNITQIYNGNKVYTISKEDKEITSSDREDGDSLSPTSILGLYKKGFDISSEGSSTVNNIKCSIIKLVPTDTKKSKSIILAIADNKIVRVSENYNDGSSLILTIIDFKENLIVNKSLLTFDKNNYKDYTLTEL
jgi:outer membrane lipoprotein-sorting protein